MLLTKYCTCCCVHFILPLVVAAFTEALAYRNHRPLGNLDPVFFLQFNLALFHRRISGCSKLLADVQ
jgi:hypothetical protein